jgi:hypothetical protein
MTAAIVTRVEQLIALALDPAASEAEARTAAYVACSTIRQHGLTLTEPRGGPPLLERTRRCRTRFSAPCLLCLRPYSAGETVLGRPGVGAAHLACVEIARAA